MSAVMDSMDMPREPMDKMTRSEAGRPRVTPPLVEEKKLTSVERLESTRSELRLAMTPAVRPTHPAKPGVMTSAAGIVDTLRSIPGASLVVDTFTHWWARHPLHDASVIAREASGAILRPIARDNPMKLVFGAVLIGALLVILKPWRLILRSAIFAGLVPQFAAMALRRLPLSTWIGMFANRSRGKARSPSGQARATERPRSAA